MPQIKKSKVKKVLKHLKEDVHEAKESIREDKKLARSLKRGSKKK